MTSAPPSGVMLDLSGRTVVVAGAGGGGIGTAVSGLLARAGATVVGLDNRAEALDDFRAAVAPSGRGHVASVTDLRDPEAVESAVAAAAAIPGAPLHGLVHVAGGMGSAAWDDLMDMPLAVFDDVVERNLRTMVLTSAAVGRRLRAQGGGGSIVALSSVAGLSAMPYGAPYPASKAALMSVVRTAALEWGRYGIRVNSVAPGTVRTPQSLRMDRRQASESPAPDTAAERAAVPLGRRGHADDIAGAVLFLLSDLAQWITGQVLAVDGGSSARPSFLGDDNLPVFVRDEGLRARLRGDPE